MPSALACPASLKGVLRAVEAAAALAEGLRSVDGVEAEELPQEAAVASERARARVPG